MRLFTCLSTWLLALSSLLTACGGAPSALPDEAPPSTPQPHARTAPEERNFLVHSYSVIFSNAPAVYKQGGMILLVREQDQPQSVTWQVGTQLPDIKQAKPHRPDHTAEDGSQFTATHRFSLGKNLEGKDDAYVFVRVIGVNKNYVVLISTPDIKSEGAWGAQLSCIPGSTGYSMRRDKYFYQTDFDAMQIPESARSGEFVYCFFDGRN